MRDFFNATVCRRRSKEGDEIKTFTVCIAPEFMRFLKGEIDDKNPVYPDFFRGYRKFIIAIEINGIVIPEKDNGRMDDVL